VSQENEAALRAIYAEWGRGNFRTNFYLYDPSLEWGWSSEFPGIAGVYHDPVDPNPRLREWLSPWEHWEVAAEKFITHGNRIVVMTRYAGRSKGGGVPVSVEGAHVWDMRQGKAIRLEIFADRALALEAVGLAE
jgi:ketosteroid isomerase-like protein